MICPNCNSNLEGGLIWETGLQFAYEGRHYEQQGIPAATQAEAERMADDYAEAYGASRENQKRWGRQIGIEYDRDRIEAYLCPDCNHQWSIT